MFLCEANVDKDFTIHSNKSLAIFPSPAGMPLTKLSMVGVSPRADLFSSTLSCNKQEDKNHQTSHFARAHPFPSTRQLCARAPLSINQATLRAFAPFNQPGNSARARPFQSTRQLCARPFQSARQEFNHLHTSSKLSPSTPHGLGPPSSTCPNS